MLKSMVLLCVLVAHPTIVFAQYNPDAFLKTQPLIESSQFDRVAVEKQIRQRLESDIYADYTVDLGVDDPSRCEDAVFEPFKTTTDGKSTYSLKLKKGQWSQLDPKVQDAVIAEIVYYTWGHPKNEKSVFAVSPSVDAMGPLDLLSPHLSLLYLQYAHHEYLEGGAGKHAYGPNCWYTSIAGIAASGGHYAKARELESSNWSKHRFMGATEFRFHMREFEVVESPQFGDIVRYYTDQELFLAPISLSGGELHAAIYVGREVIYDEFGASKSRSLVLSKNGRDDWDVLKFQDVETLDSKYLFPDSPELIKLAGGKDPRKKGYFRVRKKSKLIDPMENKDSSHAYPAFLIDNLNYRDRWDCLAGKIAPPPGGTTSAYSYPRRWTTISMAQ